jgi:hypothetical protein
MAVTMRSVAGGGSRRARDARVALQHPPAETLERRPPIVAERNKLTLEHAANAN